MADNKTSIEITAVDKTAAAFTSIRDGLEGLDKSAAASALSLKTLGVTLSAGAFVAYVKHTIDAADAMNDLSQRVGVGIKELAGYKLAAEQSGTSLEAVAKGIKGLSTYMVEHVDALKNAGITAKDADGAMTQLADLFSAMPDGVEKTAFATKLFGKAGMDMIPMLNLGSQGLEEARAKSAAYAAQMERMAPQADRFNDRLEELKLAGSAAGMNIANILLPGLTKTATAMAEAAQESGLFMALLVGIGGLASGIFGDHRSEAKKLNDSLQAAEGMVETIRKRQAEKGLFYTDAMRAADDKRLKEALPQIVEIKKQLDALSKPNPSQKDKTLDEQAQDIAVQTKRQQELMRRVTEIMGVDTPKAATAAQSAYDNLIKSIKEKIAAQEAELAAGRPLTEAEKLRLKLETDLAAAMMQKGAGSRTAAQALIEQTVAEQALIEQQKEAAKLAEEVWKLREKSIADIVKEAEETRKGTESIVEENTTLLLGVEALDARKIALIDTAIATKEHQLAMIDETWQCSLEAEAIRDSIKALQERKAALTAHGVAQQTKKERDAAAREWEKFNDDIERGLTDALMRGFENGESFGENFVKSLENTLKTAALKIVVQAIVDPVMGGIRGVSGGGVSGGAMGGGGSSSGGFGFSSLNQTPFTDALFSLNRGVGDVGGIFGSYGNALYEGAGFLDSYGGYIGAVYQLSQGNYGSAAGAAIGTMIGGPVGGMIGGAIGSMVDGGGEDPHNNPQVSGFEFGLSRAGVYAVNTTDAGFVPSSLVAGPTSGSGWWGDSTALTAEQIAAINRAATDVFAAGAEIAAKLGVNASVINSASVSSLTDGTAGNGHINGYFSSIEQALSALGDEIAQKLVPNIEDFQIAGKTLWQTLEINVAAVEALRAQFEDFRNSIALGDMSTLDPLSKYRLAKDLYTEALAGNDANAIAQAAQQFLQASRAAFASSTTYAADYDRVIATVTAFEERVTQLPWEAASNSAAPPSATDTAIANNTQAAVAVNQAGFNGVISRLDTQSSLLSNLISQVALNATNPNLRVAA